MFMFMCMFYKDYLPVIRGNRLCASSECIVSELNWGKNLYFLLATIDLRLKLQMNLRTIIKIFT